MLAVVEDDGGVGAAEPFDEGGLATGHVQRGDHGVDDVVGASSPSPAGPATRHRPDAGRVRWRSRRPSCRRHPVRRSRPAVVVASRSVRSATTPSRPTSSVDIDGRFPTGVARSAGGASVRRCRARRRGARIWCSSCCSCGPGSRPSSSASRLRTRAVRGQRVGLAAASVQRRDQQRPTGAPGTGMWPLRPLPGRRSRRRHRPSHPGREPRLEELHPGRFESGPVRRDPVTVAGSGQDVAAVPRATSTRTDRRRPGRRRCRAGRTRRPSGAARRGRRRRPGRRRACSRRRR